MGSGELQKGLMNPVVLRTRENGQIRMAFAWERPRRRIGSAAIDKAMKAKQELEAAGAQREGAETAGAEVAPQPQKSGEEQQDPEEQALSDAQPQTAERPQSPPTSL